MDEGYADAILAALDASATETQRKDLLDIIAEIRNADAAEEAAVDWITTYRCPNCGEYDYE